MKKKILLIFIFVISLFTVMSCGEISEEDIILIDSIQAETMNDGRTKVTIKYQNEDVSDNVFYIPKGKDGIGISDFVYSVNKEDNTTDITFSFTDKFNDYVVKVPNGVGIKNITYQTDTEGNTLMTFIYTDGNMSDPIKVLKGEIGTSLVGFTPTVNDDDSVDIQFVYSDGSEYVAKIPAPQKGDEGRGIDTMLSETDADGNYSITVYYTDGTLESFTLDRPASILSGTNPSEGDGIDGDLFYDTATKTLYNKADGVWNRIIQFDDDTIKYTVSFNLNCDDATAKLNGKSQISVKKLSYLSASSIPYPTRDGYHFDGWYLTEEPDINNGIFTDMTLITSDLVLYAKWVLN